MIDATNYSQLKEKKVASLKKVGESYVLVSKRFDSNTGEELTERLETVDLENLKREKANYQKRIDDIDAVLNDINNLVPEEVEEEVK